MAYDAQEAMDHHFYGPRGGSKAHNLALLITSVDGSPLVDCSDSANYTTVLDSIDQSPAGTAWYNMFVGDREASATGSLNTSDLSFYPGKQTGIADIICDK